MAEPTAWLPMSTAPKDGTRIIVTVRAAEQGPADVDTAYWARADRYGAEGWRATDSSPGCIIAYADPEIKCWMPLPGARASEPAAALPAPYEGDGAELDGSGI